MTPASSSRLWVVAVGLSAAALGLTSTPAPAHATGRALPFSYPYETLPAGKLEVEQYTDLVPTRFSEELPDGTRQGVFGMRAILQTELEYGLLDRLEVAWYFVFDQNAGAGAGGLGFRGVKQRARLRLAEAGDWPVNVGLYFEIAEFTDEIEFEQKILLSRRFGRVNLVTNLWVEQEFYFRGGERKFIYNPTAGIAYNLSPNVIVGAEYWARGRFDRATNAGLPVPAVKHYAGPTALVQAGEAWLAVGAYLRMDGVSRGFEIDEPFGRLWVRALIGLGF